MPLVKSLEGEHWLLRRPVRAAERPSAGRVRGLENGEASLRPWEGSCSSPLLM